MIPHVYSAKKEEEIDIDYDFEKAKRVKWHHRVLLDRPSKLIVIWILTAIVVPLLLYRFLFYSSMDHPPSDGFSTGSCLIPREARLSCGVGNTTQANCHPQCCFDLSRNLCFHRFPSRFSYIANREWDEHATLQPRISTVPYASQNSITNLKLSIDEQSPTHLTLTFYDARNNNFTGKRNENNTYTYSVTSPEVNVIVNSTQGTVFTTGRGPLIASENIWEIAFKLTDELMFGLGELPLKPGTTKVLYNHNGGLNTIPLIFAKANGFYHGVLFDGSSPTEVSVHGNNNIVLRSITSEGLKLHLFMGPKPKDVMEDAMTVIGTKGIKLEYWMLGAHICSETTDTLTDSLANLRSFITNATRERLPYESHCGTGPVVFNANQCDMNDTQLIQTGIDVVRQARKRFVPHVSPYIRFDGNITSFEAKEDSPNDEDCYRFLNNYKELLYRRPTSEIYQGLAGEYEVLYPSYDNASVEFMKGLWIYNATLDGLILENSWPLDQSNKTYNDTAEYLPYFNENFVTAFNETPPWHLILINDDQKYFQKHNRYGNDIGNAFRNILDKPTLIWSSSQWMNAQLAVNKQNVDALWANLHKEMVEAALGGISGHWYWSSPICGDTENFDPETQASLCVKWYMAGTFFPLLKIHSRTIPRTPLAFNGTHRNLMVNALNRRLSFLPYLYTVMQEGPVLRPMFYQFPEIDNITGINSQFSVGEDLAIVPNLQPLQTHVHFWLPPGSWYEMWSGMRLEGDVGQAVTMSTTEADFLIIIRGGSVVVLQKDTRETAEETRLRSALSLTIALECKNNRTQCDATGKLFIAENMTLLFKSTEEKLAITTEGNDLHLFCDPNRSVLANTITEINVFGLKTELNNNDHHRRIQTHINLCNLANVNEFPLS